MGHERVGILPRRKRWTQIVDQIADFHESNDVSEVAKQTIQNVRKRFEHIERDNGVQSAFKFLVLLSHASKSNNPSEILSEHGINLPYNFTPLHLAKAVNEWTDQHAESNEYAAIAIESTIRALSEWYFKHETRQVNIFTEDSKPSEVWREASQGAGFCELSRLYFSKFTENYLNYFLEREASASLNSIEERDRFANYLENHIDEISNHAFETAKITQSFAASWFNKNVKEIPPTDKEIQGFLSHAFQKMRDELLREEE
ncbi:MAG: hypothetical protein WDZ80_07345 [Candidatus Paceibacterota bacterium]